MNCLQEEGKEMENKYGCYACGKEVPTFKETLLIIAKFLQNPKTPQKIIDQAHTDLGKMGDLLDKLEKKDFDKLSKERVMEGKDPFQKEQDELKESYQQSLKNKKERTDGEGN